MIPTINLSKKLVTMDKPATIDDTAGLERLLFHLQQPPTLEERAEHFDEIEDITDLAEKVRIEAERDLFGWLGIGHNSEPAESSTATDLAYGCYDLTAEQRDYLDWQRETMQTRESDRPY